jgi:hypothetical protein
MPIREISKATALDLLSPFFPNLAQAKQALKQVDSGKPLNWVRHSHVNRTVQHFSLCKAAGKGQFYKESVENVYCHQQEWPEPVSADECSKIRMTSGGEDRISIVIHAGKLKQWVGISWVELSQATEQDYYTYPTVASYLKEVKA